MAFAFGRRRENFTGPAARCPFAADARMGFTIDTLTGGCLYCPIPCFASWGEKDTIASPVKFSLPLDTQASGLG